MLKDKDLFDESQETFKAIKAKSFVVTPSLPEKLKDTVESAHPLAHNEIKDI